MCVPGTSSLKGGGKRHGAGLSGFSPHSLSTPPHGGPILDAGRWQHHRGTGKGGWTWEAQGGGGEEAAWSWVASRGRLWSASITSAPHSLSSLDSRCSTNSVRALTVGGASLEVKGLDFRT